MQLLECANGLNESARLIGGEMGTDRTVGSVRNEMTGSFKATASSLMPAC